MKYEKWSISRFFSKICSEDKARELAWRYKLEGKSFICDCGSRSFYQLKQRVEVRECKGCRKQHRLRVGTIFENSKIPMLTWMRAIFLMTSGKRGVSALELQRQLGIKRYETAWSLLKRLRLALSQRDQMYSLSGVIELDGTGVGKRETNNQKRILVAIEQKDWVNEKGEYKRKAGFAKVLIAPESYRETKSFIEKEIENGSFIKTDGAKTYGKEVDGYKIQSIATYNDPQLLDFWLPWVHKFISNAKSWIQGTHHGVSTKYLKYYLAEYTYRFNRRHDPGRMFSRALRASCNVQIKLSPVPSG